MNKLNTIPIGIVIGLISPLIMFLIISYAFYSAKYQHLDMSVYFEIVKSPDVLPLYVALSGLPNLAVFYFFIQRHMYQAARGTIFSTFILAGIIVYLKFIR